MACQATIRKMLLPLVAAHALLGACGHVEDPPSVCRPGWISDQSGSSVIWSPGQDEMEAVRAALRGPGRIECIHRLPSGRVVVVQEAGQHREAATLRHTGGEFVEIDRSAILRFE